MHSFTSSGAVSAADRRRAHTHVGVAVVVAFVALLLLGAARGVASADDTTPAATPAPAQSAPAQPQQTTPADPGAGPPDGGGFGRRDGGGRPDFGGGGSVPGGGGTIPAPSTGGSTDGSIS
jgi:hypothetical protein